MKDIDFSFKPHPLTGDIATKSGNSAVQQSLRNLIRTNFYDRGFNVEVGSNIDFSLFENITSLTQQQLKDNITNVIQNFEPRVSLIDVAVKQVGDNDLSVTLYYTVLNNPSEQVLTIDLSVIR
jgi:hypothetical protein